MQHGDWFLADEFNLADPNVMSMLGPLLEGASKMAIPGTPFEVMIDPNFRFFATQNDASKYQGRNKLPATLRSRMIEVQVEDFVPAAKGADPSSAELCQILARRKINDGVGATGIPIKVAEKLAYVYEQLRQSSGTRITMRELIKWSRRRHTLFSANMRPDEENRAWFLAGYSLLAPRVIDKAKEATCKILTSPSAFNEPLPSDVASFKDCQLRFLSDMTMELPPSAAAAIQRYAHSRAPPSFVTTLARLLVATKNREPVLLVGPTACKSFVIGAWLDTMGRSAEVETCYLSPETEASDLIGQMTPYSPLTALKDIHMTFSRIVDRLQARAGEFDRKPDTIKIVPQIELLLEYIDAYREASQMAVDVVKTEEMAQKQQEREDEEEEELYEDDRSLTSESTTIIDTTMEEDAQLETVEDLEHLFDLLQGAGNRSLSSRSSSSASSDGDGFIADDFEWIEKPGLSPTGSDSDDGFGSTAAARKPSSSDVRPKGRSHFQAASEGSDDDGFGSSAAASSVSNVKPKAEAGSDDSDDGFGTTATATKVKLKAGLHVETASDDSDDDGFGRSHAMAVAVKEDASGGPWAKSNSGSLVQDDGAGNVRVESRQAITDPGSDEDEDGFKLAPRRSILEKELHRSDSSESDDGFEAPSKARSLTPDSVESGGVQAEPVSSNDIRLDLPAPGGKEKALEELVAEAKEQSAVELLAPLKQCLAQTRNIAAELKSMCGPQSDFHEPVVLQLLLRVDDFATYVKKTLEAGKSDPMFAFREGPVTRALTKGGVVILEDFNLPSQAVTERLNSLFEPDRSFSLTEDIGRTRDLDKGGAGQDIKVPISFQVFATVHHENPSTSIQISPATRSRFTEIYVPSYNKDEMLMLMSGVLREKLTGKRERKGR